MEWRLSGGVGNEDDTIQVRVKLWEIIDTHTFQINLSKISREGSFRLPTQGNHFKVKNNFLGNRRPIVVGFK